MHAATPAHTVTHTYIHTHTYTHIHTHTYIHTHIHAGFVGIVPALGMLKDGHAVHLSSAQLLVWCLAMALFGVFFAVPLRRQTV